MHGLIDKEFRLAKVLLVDTIQGLIDWVNIPGLMADSVMVVIVMRSVLLLN